MSSNDWKSYRLGEICDEVNYGYTASAEWNLEGTKFLRITDIQNYFVNWQTVPSCTINEKDRKKYQLEKGDIVIARTGASTGTNYILDEETNAVFASYLIRFKINKKIADPFYIGYVLKSNNWKDFVTSIVGGSAQPGANAKQFASFELSIPNLKYQKQIASVLSALDNKIRLNLETNQTLEEISQNLFKAWFVDFNFKNKEEKMQQSELGIIPLEWRVGKLEEIYKTTSGGTPSRTKPEYYNGKIPWIKSKELNNTFILNTEESINEMGLKNSSAKFLPKNSVLIAMYGATVGEIGIVSTPFYHCLPCFAAWR